MEASTVDAQQPWLGLDSFSESTRAWFHGRDEEVAELARRVQRKPLTVLFGQSGLGKTSILRAGLVPRLRPEGFCPVYVRLDYAADSPPPAEQIKQAIFRETLASGNWTQTGAAVQGESLWEFLHHRDDMLRDAQGRTLTPLLIFDQFEEIFTLAQTDDAGRSRAASFIGDLADLVENRPPRELEARLDDDDTLVERFDFARCDYRILIALREDYLAHLEALKAAMPSITQNRMRLARMTGAQALDAVLKPGGRLVTQEVAESIVRFVAGGAELRNAEVEPSLLSLICRELNAARIAQGRSEISADLLAGSHATILAEFYERAVADQPAGVRRFIEEDLLTESGFRENIAQERVLKAFAEAGAAPDALPRLVDRRLLRIEERLDVRRVELTHDVLCSVVDASRRVRHEREARDAAEAQLAAQREREAATKAALVRARKVAAVCGVLAVVAAGAAAFGIWGMRHAQNTRALAESARGESERLIVYLLDDFYRELEPVGRLEIVGELARRALDYYRSLPAELRGGETERNEALAQVRLAGVLRNQGEDTKALKLLEQAVPTLERLRAAGDASEPTTIGLALGLLVQGRASQGSGRLDVYREQSRKAVDLLQTGASASGTSLALRRAEAAAWTQLGFAQQRTGRNEDAVKSLKTALDAYRAIGVESDNDAAANFAVASTWLVDALSALGRDDEALAAGVTARATVTPLIERSPTHLTALRGRGLVLSASANLLGNQLRSAEQVAAADAAASDWLLLARIDPTNVVHRNNLGAALSRAADGLLALGRPREALAKLLENRAEIEAGIQRSGMLQNSVSGRLGFAALLAAELGDMALHAKLAAEASGIYEAWKRSLVPGTWQARFMPLRDPAFYADWAASGGDFARVRSVTRGAREALLAVDNGGDPGRERARAETLRRLHGVLAQADLEARDYAGAEKNLRLAREAFEGIPWPTLEGRRAAGSDNALWAYALARLGRLDEARPMAAEALAFWRELHAKAHDNQMNKLDLATALVAAAWCDPPKSRPLLDEAQKAFDSIPAEGRGMRSSRRIDTLIAEARSALR